MNERMTNPAAVLPDAMKGIGGLLKAIRSSGLSEETMELVGLRASQINGCGACAYGHVANLRKAGVDEDKIATVVAWRHAPYFSDAERAALQLAETATRLSDRSDEAVPDELWDEVASHFDERQRSGLLLSIALTNFFNRLNTTLRVPAGTTW